MKEKPSEWIAISDLMAGVMAVVMLLLVVSVLQKSAAEIAYKEAVENAKSGKNNPVTKVLQKLDEMLKERSINELLSVDKQSHRLTLREGVFQSGSACLAPDARAAVAAIQPELARFLLNSKNTSILVEGHTDNAVVNAPVIDYKRFCTVYDDNFTLSAARAREARKFLLGTLDVDTARRIVVAGYGDSRPLPAIDPSDAKNRRVEVQFLME